MTTSRSRTFRSGDSEAVRLPKDVALGREIEVAIVRSGDLLTIYPSRPSVEDMIDRLNALPKPDYIEIRETDALPEPDGL